MIYDGVYVEVYDIAKWRECSNAQAGFNLRAFIF